MPTLPNRKRRAQALALVDLGAPPPERLSQPDAPVRVEERDPDGWPIVHYRSPDILTRLARIGLIDAQAVEAGERFRRDCRTAQYDPLSALDLRRPRGAGGKAPILDRVEDARERIWRALTPLGGFSAPAGSVVWHVLGRELSLQQWTQRQSWSGGKTIRHEVATGILVGALGALAHHYTGARQGDRRPAGSGRRTML